MRSTRTYEISSLSALNYQQLAGASLAKYFPSAYPRLITARSAKLFQELVSYSTPNIFLYLRFALPRFTILIGNDCTFRRKKTFNRASNFSHSFFRSFFFIPAIDRGHRQRSGARGVSRSIFKSIHWRRAFSILKLQLASG